MYQKLCDPLSGHSTAVYVFCVVLFNALQRTDKAFLGKRNTVHVIHWQALQWISSEVGLNKHWK